MLMSSPVLPSTLPPAERIIVVNRTVTEYYFSEAERDARRQELELLGLSIVSGYSHTLGVGHAQPDLPKGAQWFIYYATEIVPGGEIG